MRISQIVQWYARRLNLRGLKAISRDKRILQFDGKVLPTNDSLFPLAVSFKKLGKLLNIQDDRVPSRLSFKKW